MSRLTGDSNFLIQNIDGMVILFHEYTDEEVVKFDPSDANACAIAQKTIYDSELMNDEEKCFAHFWSGYFYRAACGG